jgi:protein-L-isoaspartate(D-aspartate) O-methyltransferase
MSTEIAFDFDKARFNMIEQQVRPWNVADAKVLALLGEVKREDFVPAAYKDVALADLEVPLGHGEGQCMLAPKVEARMLQELALQPNESVLEIGTGSGYMAALMAKLCARVTSIEIDPALAKQARANLEAAGVSNVEVRTADAAADHFAACSAGSPFDVILLSGSVTEVPADLLTVLKPQGRLLAITGRAPAMRATLIRPVAGGQQVEQPWDVCAPRLQNFPEPSQFKF